MKNNRLNKMGIYVPAVLLLIFSLLVLSGSSKGNLIGVEGYYPYVSTDIFGKYTYIASDQIVADDRIKAILKDNPSGGSIYVAFEPSRDGELSAIREYSQVEKPGFLSGMVFLNETTQEYHLQLDLNKVRLSPDFKAEALQNTNSDGTSKYRYFFYQSGTQFILESVKAIP